MTATRILYGLEASAATGAEADAAARLGFLQWMAELPAGAAPRAARAALKSPAAQNPESAAARAFVTYLHAASRPAVLPGAGRRRRNRRRQLQ